MRELSLSELYQVNGSGFNVGVYIDAASLFFPQPTCYYSSPVIYEPIWVPYTTVSPIYNAWGYQVGYEIEEGYYETYQPVIYYW